MKPFPDAARPPLVLGGAIGSCVHVAGVYGFLRLAEEAGMATEFLGPAVPVEEFLAAIRRHDPDLVAVGYRLTPESGRRVLEEFAAAVGGQGLDRTAAGLPRRFVFGGPPPVRREAEEVGLFEAAFDGLEGPEEVLRYLRGGLAAVKTASWPDTLVERVEAKKPYPVLRHHFGLPTLEATRDGVARIAEAQALDVISLGVDQNAQEFFFRPGRMDPLQDGAGGVPVRTREDLVSLYEASRRGNYPLMRSYSGTNDLLQWAPLLHETIHNAWLATPLFWYSLLDGRSRRPLSDSIPEAQAAFAWHGARGIPVECNDAHHWSLRDAPDVVAVADAYLVAYNARAAGVGTYVAQFMFNTPPSTSFRMDLAKMLAKLELIQSLEGPGFRVLKETRAGLSSFPVDPGRARGQLASSTMLQLALKPDIMHIVGFTEGDHAAQPEEVIESSRIVQGVIKNCVLEGMPDMTRDPAVQERKALLVLEARILLQAIASLAGPDVSDPLAHAPTLVEAVRTGLLDAPHLRNNSQAPGRVVTRMIGGACLAVDPETKRPLPEAERVRRALAESTPEKRAG
ncbi:MAG: cobalamin B12-binding domain-containing protein [Bacillota bacterium]